MRALFVFLLAGLCSPAQDRFYRFSVDQDNLSGAPDFSFLNRPLQPADRLYVRGAHFYRVGPDLKPNTADDERLRLFGLNLTFGACFPTETDAPRVAKRLRRLGANLVRLHHMDSRPDANPEDANSILTTAPYPTLNPVSIRRLRVFLDALKAEGIYINLNLKVGYLFRPAVDKVPALPDNMEMPFQSKPLHMLHPRMVDLQTEFARKAIRALNLKDDPVLAMVEINNESSLVEAFQRGNLDRYARGEYKAELDRRFETFLRARTRSADARSEDDFLLFLEDRDRYYLDRMKSAVREVTDTLVPLAGTQMGYGGLLNLDTHSVLDYQDNHFYIDHYSFPNVRWDARDWRIRDSSSVGTGMAVFLNMAAARELGRPYTISEYNQNWPNRHGAEIDPAVAAFAAFQDWDALMHFAYSHNRNWDKPVPSGFDLNGDWAKFLNFGQSAWLFRTGVIQPARTLLEIPVSKQLRLRAAREKRIGNIAASLASAAYEPAVALIHRVGLARKEDAALTEEAKASRQSRLHSDTGELVFDRETKIFTIDAPKAAGVFGFVGRGRTVAAGAIRVALANSARGYAAILLASLDDRPLPESGRMLLTIPGYALGTLPGSEPPKPQMLVNYGGDPDWWTLERDPAFPDKPSGSRTSSPPAWMERVESILTLRSVASRLAVYPLDAAGSRLEALTAAFVTRVETGFQIHLQADGQVFSPWYEVVTER